MSWIVIILVSLAYISAGHGQAEENASCIINGMTYSTGDRTPDACNRCWCSDGQVACNRRLCLPHELEAACEVNGVTYGHGQLTPDACNRCRCSHGRNICNRRGCPEPLLP